MWVYRINITCILFLNYISGYSFVFIHLLYTWRIYSTIKGHPNVKNYDQFNVNNDDHTIWERQKWRSFDFVKQVDYQDDMNLKPLQIDIEVELWIVEYSSHQLTIVNHIYVRWNIIKPNRNTRNSLWAEKISQNFLKMPH